MIYRVDLGVAKELENKKENCTAYILSYDQAKYPFKMLAENILSCDLDLVHLEEDLVKTSGHSELTVAHRLFFDSFYEKVNESYLALLHEVLLPLFDGEPMVVQKIPTLRIHQPYGKASKDFHVDSDFGHLDGSINFWLPLTDLEAERSLILDKSDLSSGVDTGRTPVEMSEGEILRFDAINIKHGNWVNTTSKSRVSMDFRLVPESLFYDIGLSTIRTHTPLKLGDYYERDIALKSLIA